MLEGDPSIADIETANSEVAQQQQPATRARKNVIIAIASVALVVVIATALSIKTKLPEVEDTVDSQAKLIKRNRRGDLSLVPSAAPPTDSAVTKQECALGGICTEEGSTCAIGEESCCGETFNSIECECSGGMWMCMATDACYRPDCEDSNTTAPTAALLSSCDYSNPGTFCDTDDDCTCGDVCLDSLYVDFSVCGCEVGTTNGCDANSDKPFCYNGFTVSGVDCGCRDDDDCGEGQTCGTSWCVADIVPRCSVDHNALCPPTQSPVGSQTTPPTIVNLITEDPSLEPSISSENITSVPTQQPTSTPQPTEAPTETVTTITTSHPTVAVTTISTPQPTGMITTLATSGPTEMVTAPLTIESTEELTSNVSMVDTVETTSSTEINIVEPETFCVTIKFTSSLSYPEDNGFSFLSKDSGVILLQEEVGFMTESQTEYTSQICALVPGIYTLVVTDEGSDGMFADGKGSFVVDINGTVVLVGGRFRKGEISHDINVGYDSSSMSGTDQAFLDAHNSRRKEFHESQGVTFRPMAWSPELAAGASAWAKKGAKMCSTDNIETGPFGQNFASQKLVRPDVARLPEDIMGWWLNTFDPEQSTWDRNLQPGSAVMWRSALYVGCAAEIEEIENCPDTERACYCQVTNCRYVRTTNCAVKNKNWLESVLDDNGTLCSTVFCPGANSNGDIVEGYCHT